MAGLGMSLVSIKAGVAVSVGSGVSEGANLVSSTDTNSPTSAVGSGYVPTSSSLVLFRLPPPGCGLLVRLGRGGG